MASDESMTPLSSVHSSMHDLDVDGYLAHDYTDDDANARRHDMMYDDDNGEEEEQEEEEEEGGIEQEGGVDVHMDIQMSRLSLETWEEADDGDANSTHLSDNDVDDKGGGATSCDDDGGVTWGSADYLSLPGTPSRPCPPRRRAGSTKDYASESEASRGPRGGARARRKICGAASERSSSSYSYHHRRSGRTRERQLDRAWEMKRYCHWAGWDGGAPDTRSGGSSPCVVVRTTGPGAGCMWMDMEEVKACRDLGLELPCDWTVEIPPSALTAVAAAEAGSGGDSPAGNWRISSPGSSDDPGDMKARLRVWAQAVALASASRLSS